MEYLNILLLIIFVGGILAFVWKVIRKVHRFVTGPIGDSSLGLEATDVEAFNDAARFNQGKAASTGRGSSHGFGTSAQRGPLRMGKTSDEFSKNYHKVFGRKSK